MNNSDALRIDNYITTEKRIQANDTKHLIVRLNKNHVFRVKKAKLLEKSLYFRLITKSCFADHKSGFTEVTIPINFKIFKKVIDWIITDHIYIADDDVFEIHKVSVLLFLILFNKKVF